MTLIVDNFAGGGGASLGMEMASWQGPDIAINHDPIALGLHAANHPHTRHLVEDVFAIDPLEETKGQPVALAWFSPDCKHFSKAKGGKPVDKKVRGLAWVVIKWAVRVKPTVICLENVEEFQNWSPLTADGLPDKSQKGATFRLFVSRLRQAGYDVKWWELRGCDFGAPTIRKRLFMVARRDGVPINRPQPTHGKPGTPDVVSGRLKPWRTAAEIIDWSQPCPSIFERKRPLADNTMRRIAKGIQRFVIEAESPFIVTCNHGGEGFRGQGLDEPMKTITAARDAHGLVVPVLSYGQQGGSNRGADQPMHTITASTKDTNQLVVPYFAPRYLEKPGHQPRVRGVDVPAATIISGGNVPGSLVMPVIERQFGNSAGSNIDEPLGTVTAGGGGKSALVAAFLAQHNTGVVGHDARKPLSTIVGSGTQQNIVSPFLTKLYGSCKDGVDMRQPHPTVTAGGQHVGEVRAFLMKYYGTGGQHQDVRDPMHTIPTKARMGLVTVAGIDYQIVDIGMRMLTPRELFRAQGFPDSYIIDRQADGTPITKTNQIRLCGNSVCPDVARAVLEANHINQVLQEAA